LDGDLVDLESRMSFLQDIVDRYPSYHWDDDDYPDDVSDEDNN